MEYEDVDQLGSSRHRPAGNYQELNPMTIALPEVYSAVTRPTSPNNIVSSDHVYEEVH